MEGGATTSLKTDVASPVMLWTFGMLPVRGATSI